MTLPIVSTIVAAILIILQQSLMLTVGLHRTKLGVGVGVGNDTTLERKVRRHGNLAENAALFVATLALAELCGAPKAIVTGFGSIFVLARFLHTIGFSSSAGSHLTEGSKIFLFMRAAGAFGTLLTGIGLGGFILFTIARI